MLGPIRTPADRSPSSSRFSEFSGNIYRRTPIYTECRLYRGPQYRLSVVSSAQMPCSSLHLWRRCPQEYPSKRKRPPFLPTQEVNSNNLKRCTKVPSLG